MSQVSFNQLFTDPNWLVNRVDFIKNQVEFIYVQPNVYDQAVFLDYRYVQSEKTPLIICLDDLLAHQQTDNHSNNLHFIFHSAFCCSTLLANCLKVDDKTLVLREPWVLRTLSDYYRNLDDKAEVDLRWNKTLKLINVLLSKTYIADQQVIVKATNVANNILADIMVATDSAQAILMYSNLEEFLISNLKKREDTKQRLIELARSFMKTIPLTNDSSLLNVNQWSHLQHCVLLWYCQLQIFNQQLSGVEKDRYKTLDSEMLLTNPEQSLLGCFKHFAINIDNAFVSQIINSDTFLRHAKDPNMKYSEDQRLFEKNIVLEKCGDYINETMTWAKKMEVLEQIKLPLMNAVI